ncbi:MAG: ABC transporter ATP-binding protein [Calditrichaeota bacterium]|nr:ABC transporter ATP-binding protein [Calditrichota bacterium]
MKLYFKILGFIKPYWQGILLIVVLTFSYVIFNNLSIWVSVDFVRELFSPAYLQQQSIENKPDASEQKPAESAKPKGISNDLQKLTTNTQGIYQKINAKIKSIILKKDRFQTLKIVCLVIFLAFFLKNISQYFRKLILSFIQIKVVVDIRNRLQNKLLHLPLSFYHQHHSGTLTSIVFNDVNAVQYVLNQSFGKIILSPLQIIANIIILLMISVKLSLYTFIILPVSFFVIYKIGQSIRRRSRKVFKQVADVVLVFQEAISSISIVKIFTNEEKEENRFKATNYQYFKKLFRAERLKIATTPINEILMVLTLVLLLWIGGRMVYLNAGLEAEDFVRFLVFLFAMFKPIQEFSGINNTIQTGLAAAERIFNILEQKEELYQSEHSRDIEEFKDKIRYENVYFRYNPEDEFALENINITIHKGETVAFVGHSGAGKTTIVDLLPRFYDVSKGRITIDGIDIRELNLQSLRKLTGLVTQETILFNDTIRTNIAYGSANATEEDIINAAKAANAWEFIQQFDLGLDTHIGERGVKLSGGQKQRLAIARAILKNPPILILDEATSALDTESERLVQEAIEKLMKNRTVLVIAHRLSTVRNADKIVVMNHGSVDHIGTHKELYSKSRIYRTLYDNQLLAGQVAV